MTSVTEVLPESIACRTYQAGTTVTWIVPQAKWWTLSTHALQTPGELGNSSGRVGWDT